jgi:hypothetical protein
MTEIAGCCKVVDGVSWTVERTAVTVFAPHLDRALRLDYPEAAIWDLAVRGQPVARIAVKLEWISGLDAAQARSFVAAAVGRWLASGLMTEISPLVEHIDHV